jgi:hypothetical protein
MNLTKCCKFTRLTTDGTNYSNAAGTTDTLEGTVVDMANFEAVTFLVSVGAITTTGTVACTVQQGTDATVTDAADLSGPTHTFSAAADSNKTVAIEVNQPRERYLRLKIVRATANAVIDSVVAIQTGPRVMPPAVGAQMETSVFSLSPAEA